LRRPFGFAIAAGFALLLLPDPARAQVVVKVNDVVNFRLGFQLQGWSEFLQDPISEGYQDSFKIRRVRLILAGNIAKDVSFFFQTDNPNMGATVGTATKAINTGFLVQDAFGEWHAFSNPEHVEPSRSTGHVDLLQSALPRATPARCRIEIKSYLRRPDSAAAHRRFSARRQPAARVPPVPLHRPARLQLFDTEKGLRARRDELGRRGSSRSAQATTRRADSPLRPWARLRRQGLRAYGADFMIDLPSGRGTRRRDGTR
jgi:hypothetical protein